MRKMKKLLTYLVSVAEILGLDKRDVDIASEYIEYNEFGVCFDHIVVQMYEYDIYINDEVYALVTFIGNKMSIPINEYSFLRELIRDEIKIPECVK